MLIMVVLSILYKTFMSKRFNWSKMILFRYWWSRLRFV